MADDINGALRMQCLVLAATASGTAPKEGAEVVALAQQYADFVMPPAKVEASADAPVVEPTYSEPTAQ